jgi:hypothetical protein
MTCLGVGCSHVVEANVQLSHDPIAFQGLRKGNASLLANPANKGNDTQ